MEYGRKKTPEPLIFGFYHCIFLRSERMEKALKYETDKGNCLITLGAALSCGTMPLFKEV